MLDMKNTRAPTLMAFLALSLLLLLPGYKKNVDNEQYPAPVAKPIFSVYVNFAASGLYDGGQTTGEAVHKVINSIDKICQLRGSPAAETANVRSTAESLLNDRILGGQFKAYELFFYFRDPQNFAVILNGEFASNKIAELIGEGRVNAKSEGLTTILKPSADGKTRLHVEVKNDQMLICPEDIAGNIIDSLNNKTNLLGNELAAFDKMVRNRPALAAEVNLDAIQKVPGTMAIPQWLKSLKHLRLIAASRMTKMQMFVPENLQREALAKVMVTELPAITSATGDIASLSLSVKGNSIFVEAAAEKDMEKSISSHTAAFLLHFFVRSQKNNSVLTASTRTSSEK